MFNNCLNIVAQFLQLVFVECRHVATVMLELKDIAPILQRHQLKLVLVVFAKEVTGVVLDNKFRFNHSS